ncbi:MAG: OsmC family protein [Bacillaceae bacterium]|nr:OsmC family protein [Bacillaceae bacterium]
MKSTVAWKGKMRFEAEGPSGHTLIMDASPDIGGENTGPRPMEILLHSVAGCSGIDIIMMLKKMRLDVEHFSMELDGKRADDHPRRFTDIHIVYKFEGDLPPNKVERAVRLSVEKYCSVSKSLNANITYHYEINGERFDVQ